jgi:hypothetical protein
MEDFNHKTCATCANATKKMTERPCAACIDAGDKGIAPHYSYWEAKQNAK